MHITLTPQQVAIIESAVHSGLFASPDEVINTGLRVIQEREQRLIKLRAIVQESLADDESEDIGSEEMQALIDQWGEEAKAQGF